MRLIWNIHMYLPEHACGSETMAHHINKFLIKKGHHVRVILQQYNGLPYIYEGVEVFPATGHLDTFRWSDCILTHLDFTQFSLIMSKAVKRPLIIVSHNDIPYQCILNGGKNNFSIYNSQWIADKLNYNIPGYILHPPCDIKDYTVESTREYITLISLNERKGGNLFYEIAQAVPDKKFLGVVGSYDNQGPLKMTQLDIINKLIQLPNFTLVANTPDILATYRRTRLLLMPSDYESWGRTATEAMCSGIPVICTPTPGLKENCGEAAVYVGSPLETCEPGDAQVDCGAVQDWVEAIRSMDNPAKYEKKSLLCKARAQELDPNIELEGLEQFLYKAVSGSL